MYAGADTLKCELGLCDVASTSLTGTGHVPLPAGLASALACCAPQLLGHCSRIDLDGSPPRRFVPTVVQLAVMETAQRNRKLIADLPTESAGLSKAEMMGIAGLSPANNAGLRRHKRQMILVTAPSWFSQNRSCIAAGVC